MKISWPALSLTMLALGICLVLAGCNEHAPIDPSHRTAICKALIGPIKYNTQNADSERHAGLLLGLDLKQRNQVGQNLHCPKYR